MAPTPAQRFLYILDGEVEFTADGQTHLLGPGGFAYIPFGAQHTARALSAARAALIEKIYEPFPGDDAQTPEVRIGNETSITSVPPAGRRRRSACRSLMPDGPAYDFAVNTMTYDPGAALSTVEIHVMEHGLLHASKAAASTVSAMLVVPGRGRRRLHLDGPLLPAVVPGALGRASRQKYLDLRKTGAGTRSEDDAPHDDRISYRSQESKSTPFARHSAALWRSFSEHDPPVVTRVVFNQADLRARAFVKNLCEEAWLTVTEDAIGNTFARWHGSEPDLAPIATGSHIDAIPNAGSYDGTVGVLGGLEAIRSLQRAGFRPRRSPYRTDHFSPPRRPTRFGIGCLGSRMDGEACSLPRRCAGASLTSRTKPSTSCAKMRDSLARSNPSRNPLATSTSRVELHIEQGPLLEQEGIDVTTPRHPHSRARQYAHPD